MKSIKIISMATLLVTLVLFCGCQSATLIDTETMPSWKSPRGGFYNNSGTMLAPKQPLKVVWETEIPNQTHCNPVAAGGMVVLSDDKGVVYCIDGENGNHVWEKQFYVGQISPVISKGRVLFGDQSGFFYSLNLADGKQVWSKTLSSPVVGWPTIDGDRVWVATRDDLYCLEEAQGTEIFKKSYGVQLTQTPSLQRYINLVASDTIIAVVPEDGKEVWRKKLEYPIIGPAVCVRDELLVTSGKLLKINALNGEIVESYEFDTGSKDKKYKVDIVSPPSVYVSMVAIGLSNNMVVVVRQIDLKPVWGFGTNKPVTSSAIITKESAFLAADDGKLYVIDVKNGNWQWHNNFKSPVVGAAILDTYLFALSESGILRRMDQGGEPLTQEEMNK
ncbi:MAG: outer membrane biogenesis protein BamB [bacterium ADurb.Bin132]|nr:MAG: outer membrane biogenesis protein BamB [bacterium ADurb.Bin132]